MDSNDLERASAASPSSPKRPLWVWKDVRGQYRRHSGSRRFRRRGRAHSVDGRRRLRSYWSTPLKRPMPQTKFVVGKALKIGLKPVVCVNKVDKADARGRARLSTRCSICSPRSTPPMSNSTFRSSTAPPSKGWMALSADGPKENMKPLVRPRVEACRRVRPKSSAGGSCMLGTLLEANPYLGRHRHGPCVSPGSDLEANPTPVKVLDRQGDLVETGRVSKILAFRGIERAPIGEAIAGDIVLIAGLEKFNVADTPHESGRSRAAACASRSIFADAVDDLFRQRQPARGKPRATR